MKKELHYAFEYIIKSENQDEVYKSALSILEEHLIYTPSSFDIKKLKILAKNNSISFSENFDDAINIIDIYLDKSINKDIQKFKKNILYTILSTNFPNYTKYLDISRVKFESKLDKVQFSIYNNISAYINSITKVLEIFYVSVDPSKVVPEVYIEFANKMHNVIFDKIFNETERELLYYKLKEIMSVYLSIYIKNLYV